MTILVLWEFWSESKLGTWILSPNLHDSIELCGFLHFCLDFNPFFWISLEFEDVLWVTPANLSYKAGFLRTFPFLSCPVFQLANILNPEWILKAGVMAVFTWFFKCAIISEITLSRSLLLCGKCYFSTKVCEGISVQEMEGTSEQRKLYQYLCPNTRRNNYPYTQHCTWKYSNSGSYKLWKNKIGRNLLSEKKKRENYLNAKKKSCLNSEIFLTSCF